MRPDNRRIDHLQRDITCATSGKRLQDHVEDAAIGPASKLPEDRIPVAKFLRQVTPRRARPHLPKNRIKHTAMVARRSATTSDKERFKIRPLIVRHQPANHSCSPQRTALNQFTIPQSITLSTAPSLYFCSLRLQRGREVPATNLRLDEAGGIEPPRDGIKTHAPSSYIM